MKAMLRNVQMPLLAAVFAAALSSLPASAQTAPQGGGAGYVRVAGLFGETDEEKAARIREDNQDAAIADLKQRVGDLENTVQRLTGQNEQLTHQVQEFNQKIDRMQKDFDYKLCQLSAQQLSANTDSGTGSGGALACNPAGQAAPPPGGAMAGPQPSVTVGTVPPAPASQGGPVHLAPPPGVLGTLPKGTPMPQPGAQAPAQTAMAGPDPAQAPFNAAMNMLAKAQYDQARAAFQSVADTYPDGDLAPQSLYWAGDVAFVQKDYDGAIADFVDVLKKYPKSPRGPESMLKLGQSLIATNRTKEGCTTLGAIKARYADASKNVLDKAADVRKAAACK